MDQPDPFGFIGLTYDDVMLLPGHTDVIPSEASTTSRLTKRISVNVPLLSAAMDTVTEARMAIAMARQGGIGILHRNMSIEDQAAYVDKVKRSESGMITNPVTTTPDATVADVDAICGQFRVSGLPVVESDGTLVGIITNRDMRFVAPFEMATTLVRDVMTKAPLVTALEGIDPEDAVAIFAQHKIEKLPWWTPTASSADSSPSRTSTRARSTRTPRRTTRAACGWARPSASSVTPGSAPRPCATRASTCSWSTRPTARARASSTWSVA